MKHPSLLALLFFVLLLTRLVADPHPQERGHLGQLSEEEVQLIMDFRENPTPYRHVLYAERRPPRGHNPIGPRAALLGPRDIIDVVIQEGAIAFHGRRSAYDPFSFRIQRGQTIEVVARRRGRSDETAIVVAFRADGLHFDLPPQRSGSRTEERGMVVINEDGRWKTGEAIRFDGEVNSSRSRSEAQGIVFNIKYIAAQ
ncbi:MAG: hypothetical protein IPP19_09900 [Verrucomicrobia bacterium]|nr:hypothetical protein [Verrucomicrobiota bacterium]